MDGEKPANDGRGLDDSHLHDLRREDADCRSSTKRRPCHRGTCGPTLDSSTSSKACETSSGLASSGAAKTSFLSHTVKHTGAELELCDKCGRVPPSPSESGEQQTCQSQANGTSAHNYSPPTHYSVARHYELELQKKGLEPASKRKKTVEHPGANEKVLRVSTSLHNNSKGLLAGLLWYLLNQSIYQPRCQFHLRNSR